MKTNSKLSELMKEEKSNMERLECIKMIAITMANEEFEKAKNEGVAREKAKAIANWNRFNRIIDMAKVMQKTCGEEQNMSISEQEK